MAKLHATCASLLGITLLLGAVACAAGDADDERAEHPSATPGCAVLTRRGICRPAGIRERVTIASGGNLLPAAGFATDDHGGYLAFGVRWGDERILSSRSAGSWAFDPVSALPWSLANGATGV